MVDIISQLLFPMPVSTYNQDSFPDELIWVPNGKNPIPCLFLPYQSARFLILYLHSNAEDLGRCYTFCATLREQFQVHVIAMEYPGYGICPGGPCTEEKATECAFKTFEFIQEVIRWPLDSIKILGRSVGTGPALHLATKYPVAGLILIAPFLSVREVIREHIGFFSHFVDERFPNQERASSVKAPCLIIHGQRDQMVSFRHSKVLYDLLSVPKLLITPSHMEHNTNLLQDISLFVLPMLKFFAIPDYCFEDICIPEWAFIPPGERCSSLDAGFTRPEYCPDRSCRETANQCSETVDDRTSIGPLPKAGAPIPWKTVLIDEPLEDIID